jgi:hypothetical protein
MNTGGTVNSKPVSKAAITREVRAYYSKHGYCGFDLQKEAKRIWKQLEQWHGGAPLPKIEVRVADIRHIDIKDGKTNVWMKMVARSGVAFTHEKPQRIRLEAGVTPHTLAHELVHCADYIAHRSSFRGDYHGERFYRMLKHALEKRWKIRISFAQVTRWGYEVDDIIEYQTRSLWSAIAQDRKFSWEQQ